jgi:hypothetical protein
MSDSVTKHYVDNCDSISNTNEPSVNKYPTHITSDKIVANQITADKIASNTITTQGIYPNTHTFAPSYNTYDTSFQQQSFDPWVSLPPVAGIDELCALLGVDEEPSMSTGNQGPILMSVSGKRYALVNILRAQMEFMARLNMLLVHRQIVPESE